MSEHEHAQQQLAWMDEMERVEKEVFPDSRPRSEVRVILELGDHQAAALAQTIIGFAAPGRYESGRKIPAKVQARAEELARAAVKMVREVLD